MAWIHLAVCINTPISGKCLLLHEYCALSAVQCVNSMHIRMLYITLLSVIFLKRANRSTKYLTISNNYINVYYNDIRGCNL